MRRASLLIVLAVLTTACRGGGVDQTSADDIAQLQSVFDAQAAANDLAGAVGWSLVNWANSYPQLGFTALECVGEQVDFGRAGDVDGFSVSIEVEPDLGEAVREDGWSAPDRHGQEITLEGSVYAFSFSRVVSSPFGFEDARDVVGHAVVTPTGTPHVLANCFRGVRGVDHVEETLEAIGATRNLLIEHGLWLDHYPDPFE